MYLVLIITCYRVLNLNSFGQIKLTFAPLCNFTAGKPPRYSGQQPQPQKAQQQNRGAFGEVDPMAAFAKYPPGAMQNLQALMQAFSKDKAAKGAGSAEAGSTQHPAGLATLNGTSQQSPMTAPRPKPTPPKDLVAQMLGQSTAPPPPQQQQQGPNSAQRQLQPQWASPSGETYSREVPRVRTARVHGEMASMPFPKVARSDEDLVLSPRSAKMLVDVLHEGVPGVAASREGGEGRDKATGASDSAPSSWADTKPKFNNVQAAGGAGIFGGSRKAFDDSITEDGFQTPTHARLRTGVAEYLRLHPFDSTGLDIHDTFAMKRVNSYMCAAASAHGRPFRNMSGRPIHRNTLQDKTNLPALPVLGK
jgi:hypothetical protein